MSWPGYNWTHPPLPAAPSHYQTHFLLTGETILSWCPPPIHSMSAYPHGGKWYQPPRSAIESVTCYGVQKVERAMRSLADLWRRSQGLGCQGLELEPKASENRSRSSLGPPPTRAKRGSCCSPLHSRRCSKPSGYIILLPSLLEALKGVIWEK